MVQNVHALPAKNGFFFILAAKKTETLYKREYFYVKRKWAKTIAMKEWQFKSIGFLAWFFRFRELRLMSVDIAEEKKTKERKKMIRKCKETEKETVKPT